MDEKIRKYIKDNEIKFEIRAIDSSGDTILKYTNWVSADHLVGDAWKIDEYIEKMALEEEDDEDFTGATEGDR